MKVDHQLSAQFVPQIVPDPIYGFTCVCYQFVKVVTRQTVLEVRLSFNLNLHLHNFFLVLVQSPLMATLLPVPW